MLGRICVKVVHHSSRLPSDHILRLVLSFFAMRVRKAHYPLHPFSRQFYERGRGRWRAKRRSASGGTKSTRVSLTSLCQVTRIGFILLASQLEAARQLLADGINCSKFGMSLQAKNSSRLFPKGGFEAAHFPSRKKKRMVCSSPPRAAMVQ